LLWAKRELREETGLTAGRWSEILRMHISNSITDEEGIVYLAEDLTEGDTEFGDTEALDIRKLPLRDAIRMVESGEITDAISIAALLRIRHLAT
jgi:8-oxo-dGTP pyrophosphatase MutT (NUDIX family)